MIKYREYCDQEEQKLLSVKLVREIRNIPSEFNLKKVFSTFCNIKSLSFEDVEDLDLNGNNIGAHIGNINFPQNLQYLSLNDNNIGASIVGVNFPY